MKGMMRTTEYFSNVNGVITIGFFLGSKLVQVSTITSQDVADKLINFFHDYEIKAGV